MSDRLFIFFSLWSGLMLGCEEELRDWWCCLFYGGVDLVKIHAGAMVMFIGRYLRVWLIVWTVDMLAWFWIV